MWRAGARNWTRLALVVPIFAFVLFLLPAEINVEAALGPAKIKPLAGHREILLLLMALLVLKLARDANRLVSCWRIAGIELSTDIQPDNLIQQDYVRPVDLISQDKQRLSREMLLILKVLETIRQVLLGLAASATAAVSIVVMIATLANVISAPALPWPLSYALPGLILALLAAALVDVAAIGLLPVLMWADAWREAAKLRRPQHDRAWCEAEAKALHVESPQPWPMKPADQRKFEDRLKEIRARKMRERRRLDIDDTV